LQAGKALGAHLVFVESTARPECSSDADLPEGSERYPDLEAVVNMLLPLGGMRMLNPWIRRLPRIELGFQVKIDSTA
jgi:hypothetical protein